MQNRVRCAGDRPAKVTAVGYRTLAIVLAGFYLLYNYYDATLKERIAAQKVELTRTNATVKDLEGKLASAGDLEKQLRAEISDRASQHAMALKALQRIAIRADDIFMHPERHNPVAVQQAVA